MGEIRAEDLSLYKRLRFEFYGHIDEKEDLDLQAQKLGVKDALYYGGHITHDEALEKCNDADMLLLLGVMGSKPEIQVPSKLFEYMALKKPILSLSKKEGSIHSILKHSGVPHLLADLERVDQIVPALKRMAANDFEGSQGWEGIEAYKFDQLADRLSNLLSKLKEGAGLFTL